MWYLLIYTNIFMHVIDLKLPESFREREKWKSGANHMLLYDFVSFTLRYLSKTQYWALKHNSFLFPSKILTAKQWDTNSKHWHKVIFHQNCQPLTSNLASNNNQIVLLKHIFKKTDKKTRHQNNQQAILLSCLKGKYTEHISYNLYS